MKLHNLLLIVASFFIASTMYGQINEAIGYTGASLNNRQSVAGGFSFYVGRNILGRGNSSLSLSTNVKLGIEDKVGSGLIVPYAFLLAETNSSPNNDAFSGDGGTIHLFSDVPLLVHYNFGLGSTADNIKRCGFYFGGGASYTTTGFADAKDYSEKTAFFSYVLDGGIRFNKIMDINLAWLKPMNKQIGPIANPTFFEVSFLFTIRPVIY